MDRKKWKARIKKACEAVGTYEVHFDDVIDTLAAILEKRDAVEEQYIVEGACPVLEHTNNGGSCNLAKNPLIVLYMDLNNQAITYWRDLGLTPAGLRKINDKAKSEKKNDALAEALKGLDL